MPEIPRKRLVINFDQAHPKRTSSQATGKRRWPKILLGLLIIGVVFIALIAGGAFLWWRHYQTTPAYSLALLIDAAQRNEMTTVDQLVDTEKIIKDLAPQVNQKATARYGTSLNPSARKRLDGVILTLTPVLTVSARDAVRAKIQELAKSSEQKPFIALAIGLPYLVDIVNEGEAAKATVPIEDRRIELTLERNGDRWRVTAINDDTLLQRIVDDIMKDLPAIGLFK